MNRRNFLKACGLGVVTLGAASVAEAGLLPKPKQAESFDVVIIGAGLSGLVSACRAAEAGAKVAVLEKVPMEMTGGNSRLTGGIILMPSSDEQRDKDLFFKNMMAKSLNRSNPVIIKAITDDITTALKWINSVGIEFSEPMPVAGISGIKSATFKPGAFKGGPIVLKTLRDKLTSKNGKIFHETKALQLIFDENGSVCGVRTRTKSGMKDFMGKKVIIATGGYAGNKELLEAFIGQDGDEMMVRGEKLATGDGHFLAKEAGAGWVGMGGVASLHIAAVHPNNVSSGNPYQSIFYALSINSEGKRFVDESLGYVSNGKAATTQPGQVVAMVFDENTKKIGGVQFGFKLFEDLGIEVVEANTLDELAKKINVPANALKQTVADFNKAVEAGDKAPKANPPKMQYAYKLETPKFYAFYPLKPGITITFGGIKVNDQGMVQEADGTVIPNLFAVGEGAGAPYYEDYIAGGSLSNCITMGYRVGKIAAGK